MLLRRLVSFPAIRTLCTVVKEKFGYSTDDAAYILERINDLNNLPGNLIGVANKKKLELHSKQNGNFEDLEDLLKVHGLGAKSIKRICDKLVSVKGDPQTEENELKSTVKRFKLPILTPSLSENLASTIKTVGSINIGADKITWAKVNCISKNLEVWDSFSLETYSSLKKVDLITLIAVCKQFVEKLPVCDTYVLEDLNIGNYNGGSVGGLPKNLLTAIAATLVHQPHSGGVPKVVLAGGRAVAKWSGRLVGTEKISSQSLIGNIIVKLHGNNGAVTGISRASLPILYAEPNLRSFYLSSTSSTREDLADAILLALAFIDLAINRKEAVTNSDG